MLAMVQFWLGTNTGLPVRACVRACVRSCMHSCVRLCVGVTILFLYRLAQGVLGMVPTRGVCRYPNVVAAYPVK